jgi:tetratricopeptide (TPR) repeat protein
VAFNAGKWDEVVANLEKLSPSDGPYAAAKPLLIKSYVNLAQALADSQDNSQDNAKRTLDFYNKALNLDPSNPDIIVPKDKADTYLKGRVAFDSRQWQEATNNLNALYSNIKAANSAAKYRDTAELLYNSLIQLGDIQLSQNQLDAAKSKYQQAQSLDVADKALVLSKLADVEQRQSQTQTAAKPTPTPRPIPAPTPSPTPSCRSNFFAFNVAQPTVPNVPDKGSSSVEGRVLNKAKQPIAGAVIRATSGTFTFTTTTDSGGNYKVGGLGRARWEIVVLSAPSYAICTSLSAGVNLSGESTFIARVEFVESVP